MGWRNVNRTNGSAKIIDNNNAFIIDSGFKNWPAGSNHPYAAMLLRISCMITRCASSAPELFVPQQEWQPPRSRKYLTLISGARYGEEDP
jgi:hypothetical protein